MSVNLCVEFDGESFDLWQTPTHVTRMCLSGAGQVDGERAKRALQSYKEWVKGTLDGADRLEKSDVASHFTEIDNQIGRAKKIVVYGL